MAERRGHPVAGWVIALLSLAVAGVGVAAILVLQLFAGLSDDPTPVWWWLLAYGGDALLLVFGLWCAWRVGSGRWGLRRRLDKEGGR
jgi:hypothetical protein